MKLVKIDTCKNLSCILLFFVTLFSIIVLFSNAYGEPVNVNSLSNSSHVQDLNITTNSHSLSENIIDNKKANQLTEKFFAQIKQINDTKAVIEVFPITFNGAVIKNDTNSSQSDLLYLHKNDTFKEVNNTGFLPPPPPTISHIENEIDPMDATNFVLKYIENERVPMNATNFVVKDSDRNASEEEDDDESSRNASEENTREFYFKKSNVVSNNKLIGNKTIGNSIDNENDKLISQFSELNSSVIPNLQIQIDDSNSKTNDRKPIANAGLDQVITTDQNIVLDASASFDPEGKISSYLWKQTGTSEGTIKSSNSMIYSFPIPEGLEEKSLEFKLIVMDEKGQKDTDTINFLLNHENDEESKT